MVIAIACSLGTDRDPSVYLGLNRPKAVAMEI